MIGSAWRQTGGIPRVVVKWTPEEVRVLERFVVPGAIQRNVRGRRLQDIEGLLPNRTREAIQFKLTLMRRERKNQRVVLELLGRCVASLEGLLRCCSVNESVCATRARTLLCDIQAGGFRFCSTCRTPVGAEGVCGKCHRPVGSGQSVFEAEKEGD